jgi:pimeloyl-ACP methyl ester carboxylesterase
MENLNEFCASGASYKTEMVTVADNIRLRVIQFIPAERNEHPTVIFVAGWVSRITGWQKVLLEMTKDFPVYYVETREKISSTAGHHENFGVEAIGRDLIPVIDHCQLPEKGYILFGSSLGATAILDCCRYLTTSPMCQVLIGPNAVFRVPKFGMALIHCFPPRLYLMLMPVVKWYLKNFRLDVKADYAQYKKYCSALDAADPWKLKKAILVLSKYEVWPVLPEIRIPTLIVGASKDTLHEPENLQKIVKMLPNATYVDLETNLQTHQAEVVVAMREFVKQVKDSDRS